MHSRFLYIRPVWYLLIAAALTGVPGRGAAQSIAVVPGDGAARTAAELPGREAGPLFPSLYLTDYLSARRAGEAAKPYGVSSETAGGKSPHRNISLLLNNDILAFYGSPLSRNMGILGRYTKEELALQLDALAEEYKAVNGGRGLIKAFYIIYGTVWPQGEIGILRQSVLEDYIRFALERGILVFIDHQIGRYDPVESLKTMFPYLQYPNVHLALDPEWRTAKPMQDIGTVSAAEINQARQVMEDYIREHGLGERMLVIHQFNWRMISGRENVQSNAGPVRLVHCADGFGPPDLKRRSYAYNALARNMPIKAFKLFYNFGIPGAGYDNPLLTPKEVLELDPRPYIIMYQ
ncbi:MAG: hypothetical protein LBJ24_08205 [Treponema sp.]|jgi:hypothetical protein|nr:hypothetical protein [Treponema sp.]